MMNSTLLLLIVATFCFRGSHFQKRLGIKDTLAPVPCDLDVKFFKTRIDKFGTVTNKTFNMRYVICNKYFRDGGPILFYTGNEGNVFSYVNNTQLMYEVGDELNGILVFAEHRYFGKSVIEEGRNKMYLSAEYALADYADFLVWFKKSYPGVKNSPVISFGGSYGGMLTAWFRLKYPFIVHGAVAGSAPVAYFKGLTSQYAYQQVVTNDFANISSTCSSLIKKSWTVFDDIGSTAEGRQKLTNLFKICNKNALTNDVSPLTGLLNNMYGDLAMMNYPYPINYLEPLPGHPVKKSCAFLNNDSMSDWELMKNIFYIANFYYNYTENTNCISLSDNSPAADTALWDFLACTEMIMPIGSNGVTDMFPKSPFDFKSNAISCEKQFGVTPRTYWIETEFGGRNYNSASNIIFSNGGLDPWHPGGVLSSPNKDITIIFMPEGAHHLDLFGTNPNNPPQVNEQIAKEKSVIRGWVESYNL